MTDIAVDEDRYEKALAKLAEHDPELRSWIDNAVPDRLAKAGVVQEVNGFVIVVQDKGKEANNPFVHTDYFDLRIPSEILWDILMSLETLRYCYRYSS
jgi:hypothetical protein